MFLFWQASARIQPLAYLTWLIYVAVLKDRGCVAHEAFYGRYVANLKLPESN
jgi:hypothetical protein